MEDEPQVESNAADDDVEAHRKSGKDAFDEGGDTEGDGPDVEAHKKWGGT